VSAGHRGVKAPSVRGCRLIDLPKVTDARGALTFIEPMNHVPIEIRRIYYLYDVPAKQRRGAHAHKELEQIFIALSGSFEISVDDGRESAHYRLADPSQGLYLPPLLWRDLRGFSPGAVCLVLASLPYAEDDYIRDYDKFREVVS
jgi:dTDP-4-dehydrorhamnose 3,5-epimerase-like enzyme